MSFNGQSFDVRTQILENCAFGTDRDVTSLRMFVEFNGIQYKALVMKNREVILTGICCGSAADAVQTLLEQSGILVHKELEQIELIRTLDAAAV